MSAPPALSAPSVRSRADLASASPACGAARWADPPLARGEGRLRFARVDGATALVGSAAASPLQVLAPRRRGASAWAVLASHGGGLVDGDAIALDVEVGAHAVALVSTQAETKVYRCAGAGGASQTVAARVADGGTLALLPDPVSPFAGARYEQRQRFELAPGASLLLADALVAGRVARGERWALRRCATRNEVYVGGRLVLADAIVLEPRAPAELAERLGRFDALAVVLAVGPAFAGCARALAAAAEELPSAPGAPVRAAASPVPGGVLLRCAAATPELLAGLVRRAIAPAGDVLGAGPLPHHW